MARTGRSVGVTTPISEYPSDASRARAYSWVALSTQIAIAQRTGTPTKLAPINQNASEMRSAIES